MKISVNQIRNYCREGRWSSDPVPAGGISELMQKIGAQLGAIDNVSYPGVKYDGAVIVKVVSCKDHPAADRLHVCMIDDGGFNKSIERSDKGYVQVVCGAPNIREGMYAVWLPPGTIVPNSYKRDPFVMDTRDIRGEKSHGMLASPKELALGEGHSGILEVDGDPLPGTMFADRFHLRDDTLLDIENKMFTHRPDCFGVLGVAREIAGIQNQAFISPDWYTLKPPIPAKSDTYLPLTVINDLPALVPRFCAIVLANITVQPSPVWLQVELSRLGLRPINNIVDLTNYYMLLTGQPLHAYDYDKVKGRDNSKDGATLRIRYPMQGETLELLNGKIVKPKQDTIMIATQDSVIGIGGVMGGGDTEVDGATKNIILECANFDMYAIRRTSMALGVFTDAVTRFNKGQSPLQNPAVLAKITMDTITLAGGQVACDLIDDIHLAEAVIENGAIHQPVTITSEFINIRLGLQLTPDSIAHLLQNVEFDVAVDGQTLIIKAPFWRTDIEIPEDIVEEVGRLYGFDKLPLDLPRRDLIPASKDQLLQLKSSIRANLSKGGANEVLSYTFVHGDLIDKVGQDRQQAFRLANALSPDLQYYRLSILPSLLEKIHPNIKAGHDVFALFEIGKVHNKAELDSDSLPIEKNALGFVFSAEEKRAREAYAGAAYYQARRFLDFLIASYPNNDALIYGPLENATVERDPWLQQMAAPFEPERSAVLHEKDGRVWGIVGEFNQSVISKLKLPAYSAGFEVDPLLFGRSELSAHYIPIPRYPAVTQDVCFKVPATMAFNELYQYIVHELYKQSGSDLLLNVQALDIYQRPEDKNHKQITLRFKVASYNRTLTDVEITNLLSTIVKDTVRQLHVDRV